MPSPSVTDGPPFFQHFQDPYAVFHTPYSIPSYPIQSKSFFSLSLFLSSLSSIYLSILTTATLSILSIVHRPAQARRGTHARHETRHTAAIDYQPTDTDDISIRTRNIIWSLWPIPAGQVCPLTRPGGLTILVLLWARSRISALPYALLGPDVGFASRGFGFWILDLALDLALDGNLLGTAAATREHRNASQRNAAHHTAPDETG